MRERQPCVYILTSRFNGAFYTGVTSNLPGRMWQHREGTFEGFAKRRSVVRLVYYEMHDTMRAAIAREKQIKR